MKCPFCDANISEQSFFCPDCGKKIPRCPRCGRWYDANTKFCPKDGTKIEQDDVWNQEEVIRTVKQGKPDENDNRVSKKKVVIIIIVAVAIVAMGFLLVKAGMFLKKGNKGTSQYDNGDYVYSPLDKNISYDEDKYTVYYNNMLMAYLTENISEEEASEMAGSVDGELVGYISGCMNAIQIKVEETDLKGLESLADNLMESENVIYATFDFPISMDEEDVTNPWEDADEHNEINYNANEDNPDGNDWWAEAIGAYTAWNIVDSGDIELNAIKVGVIDNGIDDNHEDFIVDGKSKISFLDDYAKKYSLDHGTHVTGIIGAVDNDKGIRGVADQANILFVGISSEDDDGNRYLDCGQYTEITKRMIEEEAKVINCSWGTHLSWDEEYNKKLLDQLDPKSDSFYKDYLKKQEYQLQESANICISMMIELLLNDKEQFMVVKTAGNGYDNDGEVGYDASLSFYYNAVTEKRFNNYCADVGVKKFLQDKEIDYDAIKNHIMIVGAVKNEKNDAGSYLLRTGTNYGENIDIVAPGDDVFSTLTDKDSDNGQLLYGKDSGTSMAAPMVSGAVALLWSIDPELSALEIKHLLLETANSAVGVQGEDEGVAYKMLNVGAAVKKITSVATDVQVEEFDDTVEWNGEMVDGEYLLIIGYDDDGQEVWSYQTESAVMAELTGAHEIGINNGLYYIEFGGIVYALQVTNGEFKWKTDIGSVASGFDFGDDGTLYYSGYYGPDFCAIDVNGKVLCTIDHFFSNVYLAYEVNCLEGYVRITLDGIEDTWYILVDLSDYSYITDYCPDIGFSEEEQAYREFLSKLSNWKEVAGYVGKGYAVCDVNNDGKQELIVSGGYSEEAFKYIYFFYSYDDGKVNKLGSFSNSTGGGYGELYYSSIYNSVCVYFRLADLMNYRIYEIMQEPEMIVSYYRQDLDVLNENGQYERTYEYAIQENQKNKIITEEEWDSFEDDLKEISFYYTFPGE